MPIRPTRTRPSWFALGISLLVLLVLPAFVAGQSLDDVDDAFPVPLRERVPVAPGLAAAQPETVWVGYLPGSPDPNKVGVGGVCDWDTEIAGTDSTQFWHFITADYRFESTTALRNATDRPFFYFDHGNEVNRGDQNLWEARDAAGRVYRRTGVIGVWHVDDMSGVSTPIEGGASAWCGIRPAGQGGPRDAATNNAYDGSLSYQFQTGSAIQTAYPGYGDQWNQILYRDLTVGGAGMEQLSFRLRTDLSPDPGTESGGSAWFTPDPTSFPAHFVSDPRDSFAVYVGLPKETGVYDTNRRWLSEVLDYDSEIQPVKLFATTGKVPVAGSDTTVSVTIPALGGATTVRVAFQVHTNRGFNSDDFSSQSQTVDGAALIDDVRLDGILIPGGDFESASSIRPRRYDANGDGSGNYWVSADPANTWITTGKPPHTFGHVEAAASLPYEDPCGIIASPDRLCNLAGNVVLMSNHDDPQHRHFEESWNYAISPTIDLSPGSPIRTAVEDALGDLNQVKVNIEMDIWTGTMDLDQSVFWEEGGRFMGAALPQQFGEPVPNWSGVNMPSFFFSFSPDPKCATLNSGNDWLSIISNVDLVDSLQIALMTNTRCARFQATVCGDTRGTYFDNVRLGFTHNPPVPPQLGAHATRSILQDAFPFNEDVIPGSADFDTATALVKTGLDRSLRGEGVIPGDTLLARIPWAGDDTRVDLVFRILPGPGNHSKLGDPSSALIEKDPSRPFWATYLADNGPVGSPGGHGGAWSPHVWNSARMDSAERNLWPIVSRGFTTPQVDLWHGTLHEEDPNFATLGIERNVCFLVDPSGAFDNSNICCDATSCAASPFFDSYPPGAYAGQTGGDEITKEGTKILPDGYFSAGTHIEYFVRRSSASLPTAEVYVTPDTSLVSVQRFLRSDLDQYRYLEMGVLPDLWKDVRFGGSGLACVLVVDAADGQGEEASLLGALDSLGYGKNDGAGRGWKEVNPASPNPDDPGGFVPANLGQKGLAVDWYDIHHLTGRIRERQEWSLGCRLATPSDPALLGKQCRQGPTLAQLETYYNTVLWLAGDLDTGALHDGVDDGGFGDEEPSNDVSLLKQFLEGASVYSPRALWLSGDGVASDLANSQGESGVLLQSLLGATWIDGDYRTLSGNGRGTAIFDPQASAFHPARRYGLNSPCFEALDVVEPDAGATGAERTALYEDAGHRPDPSIGAGPYGASVYRPANGVDRFFTTLLDGFAFSRLRGNGPGDSQTDGGRLAWIDDALAAFGLCARQGPVIAVGELPGAGGGRLNFVRGLHPNPSLSGEATLTFTLSKARAVEIRIYDVSGRLLHEAELAGEVGENRYRWDGVCRTGVRAPAGVYFWRVRAPGVELGNARQRLVLLGGAP